MTLVKVEYSMHKVQWHDEKKAGRRKKKVASCLESLKAYVIFVKLKYAKNEEVDIFLGGKRG